MKTSRVLRAEIGHICESPKLGIAIVRVFCLSCMVFEHLITIVAPEGVNMMSPLAICLVASNCLVV